MHSPSSDGKSLLHEPWVKMYILESDADSRWTVIVYVTFSSSSSNSSLGKYPVGCVARSWNAWSVV